MIDVLNGSWAAGETKTFHVNGSYFEILECAYPIDVKLLDRNGAVRSDMRQAEASFYSEGLEFATIQITSVLAQNIRSFYGDGTAGTRRTSGVVSIVDGGKSRTMAGSAFMGYAGSAGVTGVSYGANQLWNPAGSNVNLIVEQIIQFTDTACSVLSVQENAPLSNFRLKGISKKSNGLDGIGELRFEAKAVRPTNGYFSNAYQALMVQSSKLTEPIIVMPGYGLSCYITAQLTAGITSSFEWFEELI